jgi:hypothetical protein
MMHNEHVASYYFHMQDTTADYEKSDAWWGMWCSEVGINSPFIRGLQL